jgi:hypothetical protein
VTLVAGVKAMAGQVSGTFVSRETIVDVLVLLFLYLPLFQAGTRLLTRITDVRASG